MQTQPFVCMPPLPLAVPKYGQHSIVMLAELGIPGNAVVGQKHAVLIAIKSNDADGCNSENVVVL
jgi:hypothetical protein